jgi:uroporphyrinogen-III synthase
MTERSSLAGLTIALPEHRELDRLAEMIEQLGGAAYRCPFIRIVDADDPAPILKWLDRLLDGQIDDLILLTGEGLSRIVQVARSAGLEEAVVRALGGVRTVCRGPKPVRALRAIGLRPTIVSETPTTEGIIATLRSENFAGRRVGVQLYGEEPNDKLVAFLAGAGAEVHTVSPYTYEKGPEGPVLELIAAMAEGRISVIAFTSSPQVHRLIEVAEAHRREGELRQGLERTRIAAVGPVLAATLAARGLRVDIVPERSFFLRPLVNDIAAFFAGGSRAGNGAAA